MNFFLKIIKKLSLKIMKSFTIFAIFILLAAGGIFYVKNIITDQLNPPKSTLIQRADKIADFSKIPKGYTVTKALNLFGVSAVVAEYPKTGQYMGIINTGQSMNIAKTDIETGSLSRKLQDYALKTASPSIKLNNLEISPQGNFDAFKQSVPYAKIKVKLSGIKSEKVYDGMIGIASRPGTAQKTQNELIVSINKTGTFNQKVAEKFFKSVKLQ